MNLNVRQKKNTNDSILKHFILLGIVLYESFKKLIDLLVTNKIQRDNRFSEEEALEKLIKESGLEEIRENISSKNHQDLKAILQDTDLLSLFTKRQLIDLILSNPDALEKILINERKEVLLKMTNQDLKDSLNGVEKVYKLKKSELIEILIQQDKKKRAQQIEKMIFSLIA